MIFGFKDCMENKKIIRFRNRNPGTNETLLAAVEDLKKDLQNDVVHDIVIVWRKIKVQDSINHWLTDFIWWAKDDNLAIIGMLGYINQKILDFMKRNNG